MKKIAFIGAGNMASAIAGGILRSGICPSDIILFDKNESQYAKFDNLCQKSHSLENAVENADCIFFSVKPQNMNDVLAEVSNYNIADKVFVSICAGVTIGTIENQLGNVKIIRVMPNTPLLIGQGVTALCRNRNVTDTEFDFVCSIFSASGYVTKIDEKDFNALTAMTSSSPAYLYLFAKSLIDGAKKLGFEPEDAVELVCKTIIGSTNMILLSDHSIDELIKMVKSPNGTTERALTVFEENGFSDIIADAMRACANRAEELSKLN